MVLGGHVEFEWNSIKCNFQVGHLKRLILIWFRFHLLHQLCLVEHTWAPCSSIFGTGWDFFSLFFTSQLRSVKCWINFRKVGPFFVVTVPVWDVKLIAGTEPRIPFSTSTKLSCWGVVMTMAASRAASTHPKRFVFLVGISLGISLGFKSTNYVDLFKLEKKLNINKKKDGLNKITGYQTNNWCSKTTQPTHQIRWTTKTVTSCATVRWMSPVPGGMSTSRTSNSPHLGELRGSVFFFNVLSLFVFLFIVFFFKKYMFLYVFICFYIFLFVVCFLFDTES